MSIHIDPIVVAEEQARMRHHARIMEMGNNAASALIWFKEYAVNKKPNDVLHAIRTNLIAQSTNGASVANSYVDIAVDEMKQAIIDRAMQLAKHDFDVAETLRRSKGNA